MRLPISDADSSGYVLIADHDLNAQNRLRTMLGEMGLATQAVASGEEAIAQIRQACPSLILLDPQMPQVNGYDVRAYLRAEQRTRGIPVLLVTAVPDDALADLDLSGAIGLFRKETVGH